MSREVRSRPDRWTLAGPARWSATGDRPASSIPAQVPAPSRHRVIPIGRGGPSDATRCERREHPDAADPRRHHRGGDPRRRRGADPPRPLTRVREAAGQGPCGSGRVNVRERNDRSRGSAWKNGGVPHVTTGWRVACTPVSSRRWPSWPSEFDVVVLGGGPAATPPRSTAPRPGSTSPRSRRAGSAAPACTGAASRPRSCSRRPRCCARSSGAAEFGVDAGEPSLDLGRAAGPQAGGRSTGSPRASRRC